MLDRLTLPPPPILPDERVTELWEFDEHGLMRRREASINDVAISESERGYDQAPLGREITPGRQ